MIKFLLAILAIFLGGRSTGSRQDLRYEMLNQLRSSFAYEGLAIVPADQKRLAVGVLQVISEQVPTENLAEVFAGINAFVMRESGANRRAELDRKLEADFSDQDAIESHMRRMIECVMRSLRRGYISGAAWARIEPNLKELAKARNITWVES